MTADTLFDWRPARDAAMAQVERNAGEEFRDKARAFVVEYLREHGSSSGEDITAACKAAGIVAHDDRAMGPVYAYLAHPKRRTIEWCGSVRRARGHGATGGNLWQLTQP